MEKTAKKLSVEPYKGTRDFYPEDMFIKKYIFKVMRGVAERYGYVEYDASILEETELYKAKSGEEIINEQTYSFKDRGGRDVTMRPEMTPTIARMVAKKRKELAFPLRWYSIPNLFRYEKPQRGRLREHWQLNADIFGIDSLEADEEVVALASDIMKGFGAKDDDFIIKINNRKLINGLLKEYFKLDDEGSYRLSKLMDRKQKMKESEFAEKAKEILGGQVDFLIRFLECKDLKDLPKELSENQGAMDLEKIIGSLLKKGIKNIIFDPSLMRGFDYYTSTVFEVFDTDPKNGRSLFGGGRYDNLIGIFGKEKVSGVGFGMGDVTIKDYLETHALMPAYRSATNLYVCIFEEKYKDFADELAGHVRKSGISVSVDYTYRKIGAQVKTAEKQSVSFVVCVGEDEVKNRKFKLKDLSKREESQVGWDDFPGHIL